VLNIKKLLNVHAVRKDTDIEKLIEVLLGFTNISGINPITIFNRNKNVYMIII
tara:strand:+ start:11701 stop:11859 length:159 start_codon:yes stop_codon:yes gene_type:complete